MKILLLIPILVACLASCGPGYEKERIRVALHSVSTANRLVRAHASEHGQGDLENADLQQMAELYGSTVSTTIRLDLGSCVGDPYNAAEPLCTIIYDTNEGDTKRMSGGPLRIERVADGILIISKGPTRRYSTPRSGISNMTIRPTNGIINEGDIMSGFKFSDQQ